MVRLTFLSFVLLMNSICPGRRSTFEKKIGLLFALMKNSISVVVCFVHSVLSLFALILCQVPRLLFGTSIFCSVESVFTTPCSLGAIKSEISLVCCPPQETVDVIVFAGIGERSISSYTCTSGSLAGSNASVNSPRWYHSRFSLSFWGKIPCIGMEDSGSCTRCHVQRLVPADRYR